MEGDKLFDFIIEIGAAGAEVGDWLGKALHKARLQWSDQEIKSAVENFVMSGGRKKRLNGIFFKDIGKYADKIETVSEFGSGEIEQIIGEILWTIEFRLQTHMGRKNLEVSRYDKQSYTRPPAGQVTDFNNTIESFTLSNDGTVSLNVYEKSKIIPLLEDLIKFEWLNVSDELYSWMKRGGFVNALSTALSDYFYEFDKWKAPKLSEILVDLDLLNSLLVKLKNSNMTFAAEFKKNHAIV